MESAQSERTGVFVARVWTEGQDDGSLRARIMQSVDLETQEPVVSAAASPDDVYAALRDWLETFLAGR